MTTPQRFNWKVFLVLWLASIVGVLALVPYALSLQAKQLESLPVPLSVLIPIQLCQNALLLAAATAAGMFLAYRTGLGAPLLEAFFAGEDTAPRVKAIVIPAVAIGVMVSVVIVVLDVFVLAPAVKAELGTAAEALFAPGVQPPAWQGLLAALYGGIDEEILTRLLLLSLFAFLGKFVSHTSEGRPTLLVLWIANILAAVLFGLGHLPATATLVPITPLVAIRAVVLNGIAAVAFGYLFWTYGLESAMLAHFSADIVLHVLLAL